MVSDVHSLVRPAARTRVGRRAVSAGLTLSALGVVFGDNGTSPLYAIQIVFALGGGAVGFSQQAVYGVVSLVFWSITLIVSVKYVTFVLRADNDGEGGIMALAALVRRAALTAGKSSTALVALGVFGAALFYGDSVITPAISVISAMEGLDVAAPALSHLIVPGAVAILTLLFVVQRWGTGAVGRVFGPVMVLWFGAIALIGAGEVVAHPGIVKALSPSYAVQFAIDRPSVTFVALGAVMLAITGAEALYADMGHFGRAPIRRAWFLIVLPALTLNYLGQASLILHNPDAAASPFFLLVPTWAQIPMVALATVATVIASQAVISGAFSLSRQAVQLGFLPRLSIHHTSPDTEGQIYVPVVNWALFVFVALVVVAFGSSARLGSAYGIAVSGTFLTTTVLLLAVARWRWRWRPSLIAVFAAVFLPLEGVFLAANLTKIHQGGWLPLAIGIGLYVLMTTWNRGRAIVAKNRTREEGPLRDFVDELHALDPSLPRVPGTGVFLNASPDTTPLALRANVKHNHVLHEQVVIVTARSANVPRVAPEDRVTVDDLGYADDSIAHVTALFGFTEQVDIPEALRLAMTKGLECDIDLDRVTYFLSRITVRVTDAPGMSRWRKRLFVAVARNAASAVEYFRLPYERTITLGWQVAL
jgi:KUP system potassium uptake protein